MKKNIKGYIALSLIAFLSVGLLTATVSMVLGDDLVPKGVESIDAEEVIEEIEESIEETFTVTPTVNNSIKNNNADVAAVEETTNLPSQTITIDNASSASNSRSTQNTYLYGQYLRAIETFMNDYYAHYDPNGVATMPVTTTLFAANSYGLEANSVNGRALRSANKYGSVFAEQQAPLLTAASPKVYAEVASVKQDNSQIKVSREDLEAFVLWHLAENNDGNIKAAYNDLNSINNFTNINTWNKFCLDYTNFKYADAYDEEVDEFISYYINGPFMVNCLYTNMVDNSNFEEDNVDKYEDKIMNLMKLETVNTASIPSDFTAVSLEKKVDALVDLSSMSEAEFNDYAKGLITKIIGVKEVKCDDEIPVLSLAKKQLSSPADELKEKFTKWHLDLNDDNVYKAWTNLDYANNDDDAFDALADRFDYEDYIDTFLVDFAAKYGIEDMDDVDNAIAYHLANLDADMDKLVKNECLNVAKNEEFEDSRLANKFDAMANTLKGKFMYWHLNINYGDIEDALDDIAIINALYADGGEDMDDWYNFADEFYYELTGFYPINELADFMEEVDIAAEDCAVEDEALDQNTINTLHAVAAACAKELGFTDDGEEIANFVTNLVANIGNNNAITLVANINSEDSDTAEKAYNEMKTLVCAYFDKAEDKLADIKKEEIKAEKLTDEEIEKMIAEEKAKAEAEEKAKAEAEAKAKEAEAAATAGAAEGAGASAGAAEGNGVCGSADGEGGSEVNEMMAPVEETVAK